MQKGRAIIDHKAYRDEFRMRALGFIHDHDKIWMYELSNPPPEKERGEFFSYQNITAITWKKYKLELNEDHFFLCPGRIGGFLLKSREWRKQNLCTTSKYLQLTFMYRAHGSERNRD